MAKRGFAPIQAVVELAAMGVLQMAHIARTSSSERYLAVLRKEATMDLVVVGNWGTVCCAWSARGSTGGEKQIGNGADSPVATRSWESIEESWLTSIGRSLRWWIKRRVLID